ncbi:MAG: polysaccharide biosynthesis/export family protein [Bacteroidales bacterium]|nr:polysaccharide biosynthesis/export family protein [Bacteroidales bacterium]
MKLNNLFSAFLLLAAVSCGTPKQIPYFQGTENDTVAGEACETRITLQPDDKISIIVKSRDINLTNLFNLPYYTQRIGTTLEQSASYAQGVTAYLVNRDGDIDFPVIGTIHAAGLTRSELAETIKQELIRQNLVQDPVVSVDYVNLFVSVMGEVTHPGRFPIDHDVYTILDAISAAGDLTITGLRNNVRVLRTENGKKKIYTVNLNSAQETVSSPVYYLKQNDVVYVEPNKMKARQSTVNGNNVLSTSFWVSVASLAVTIILAVNQISFTKAAK